VRGFSGGNSGALAGRKQKIMELLKNGPLTVISINKSLPEPYKHDRSVALALKELQQAGFVVIVKAHARGEKKTAPFGDWQEKLPTLRLHR
jgi:hypothetical protein